MCSKFTTKHVFDHASGETKSRAEFKLDGDVKLGISYSDKSSLASLDVEKDKYKLAYDYKSQDLAFQFTHKSDVGTVKVRQHVPGMKWEVVPSPQVEFNTKLLDSGKFKDNFKVSYDFNKREAWYNDTLKFNKKFKLRVAGHTKQSGQTLCIGYKPDLKFLKSAKLEARPGAGLFVSYKAKPLSGWKVTTETSVQKRLVKADLTYKALKGDTELVWTAFLPLDWEKFRSSRLLAKTGLKVDFKF